MNVSYGVVRRAFDPLPRVTGRARHPTCWLVALVAAALLMVGAARAAPDAGAFLVELSERAIAQLTQPDITETEKEERFRALIDEGFDIPAIGRFVLGRYWRNADDAAREDFLAAFKDMIVQRFLPVFADYSGERLKIGLVRPLAVGTDLISVGSELGRPHGEPVKIDWKVLHADGRYRIVDISAEGVSIAVTLRAEYHSVLKNNGGNVAALAQKLRAKLPGG